MQCPFCDSDTIVKGTRIVEDGRKVVRHRRCENGHRFRTTEKIGELLVEKDAGHLEPFDQAKVARGVETALYKRPVENRSAVAWRIAKSVEADLLRQLDERESMNIDRLEIGRLVLAELKEVDWLGWLRYSSVLFDEKGDVPNSKRTQIQGQVDDLLEEILAIPE